MTFVLNDNDKPSINEVVQHHGIKGMHWGNRKGSSGSSNGKEKMTKLKDGGGRPISKADFDWNKALANPQKIFDIHNRAADAMNNHHIDRINNKPEYKDKNMFAPENKALSKKYFDEYASVWGNEIKKAGKEIVGTESPSGGFTVTARVTKDSPLPVLDIAYKEISHADVVIPKAKVVLNKVGQITKLGVVVSDAVAHAVVDGVEYVLMHHGVKGMHWGVRQGAGKAGSAAVSGAKATGRVTVKGAKATGRRIKKAAKATGTALHEAALHSQAEEDYKFHSHPLSGLIDPAKKRSISERYKNDPKYKDAYDKASVRVSEQRLDEAKKAIGDFLYGARTTSSQQRTTYRSSGKSYVNNSRPGMKTSSFGNGGYNVRSF